jgi:hypothetical protein
VAFGGDKFQGMKRLALALVLLAGCSSAGGIDPGAGAPAAGSAGAAGSGGGQGGTEAGGSDATGGTGGSGVTGGTGGSGGPGGSGGTGEAGSAGDGQGGSDAGAGGSDAGAAGSVQIGGTGGSTATKECDEAATGPQEVFAQSGGTLFRIDATTKALSKVGDFSCNDSVIDIAIDKQGNLFGTTFSSLVKIDKTNAKCTIIKDGNYPNSLSFVPQGTVYPDREALVGYVGADYVAIDPVTGDVITNPGILKGGYASSGDVVSVIGGGTYLTVTGNGCDDCIVRVDPATGAMVENLGPVGYSNVFGLAFWGGEVYGFNDEGELFVYDLKTNQAKAVPIPNAPSGVSFYGAGSTTCARLTTQIN